MPKKTFVIGQPVTHSRSPLMHNFWLQDLHLDGSYQAIDVSPDDLAKFVQRIRAGEFIGGNVTLPHKQAMLSLCDQVDPIAQTIGAVNSLVVRDGKLLGWNTDHVGFVANLDQQVPRWDKNKGPAIVLGAGGAARAILVALAERGFSPIHILNRTVETATALAADLPGPFQGHGLDAFAALSPSANLLVNTSTVGMHGTKFDDLPLTLLPATALVTDIVYTPMRTPLLQDANNLGLKTADGLGMLLHQAVPGFEAWFGVRPEVTPELRQLLMRDLGEV